LTSKNKTLKLALGVPAHHNFLRRLLYLKDKRGKPGMPARQSKRTKAHANEQLLQALAESMKQPLLQIARRAELAQMSDKPLKHLDIIESTADGALQLLDGYLLSLRLHQQKAEQYLAPVSIAGVLNDTAHQLSEIAEQYGCKLHLHLAGKYEPVLANKNALEAALKSLGLVFIEAQTHKPGQGKPVIKLAAHRGKQGIVAGMFSDSEGLSGEMFRKAHQLYGSARQPLPQLTANAGAGVFIAESLFDAMSARLRVARHQKLTGLAATLPPSRQLSMV
jgi:hypothetical protein